MPLFHHVPPGTLAVSVTPQSEPDTVKNAWPELVERLRNGEQAAMEDLYKVFSGGIRFYLWRQLGAQDLADCVHDLFLIVTESIQAGELREPERLMGFVRTVVRRQIAGRLDIRRQQRRKCFVIDPGTPLADRRPNPEHRVITRQYNDIALRILRTMREREREVLERFYLEEQAAPDICRAMHLTETQFRLLKSRAKARLGTLCRNRLGRTA